MNNNNLTPKGWGNKQDSPDKWHNSANSNNTNGGSLQPKNNIDKNTNFASKETINKAVESASDTGSSEIKKTAAPNWAKQTIERSESASTSRLETGSSSPKNTQFKESDSGFNTSYVIESQKRAPTVYILCGVIGALLLGLGVFGGMKLMKNKDSNNNISPPAAESVSSTITSATNIIPVTTISTGATTTVVQQTEAATTAVITTAMQKVLKEYPASDISNYPQYINALKNNISSNMYKGIYNVSDVGYALYDINADNTPELIVLAGNPDIYSIHNGEAVGLTPFWGGNMVKGIFLYESGYIGMTSVSPDGEAYTSYFKYSGGPDTKRVEPSPEEIGKDIAIPFTPITSISEINNYISASNASKPTINAQLIVERGFYEGVEVYLSVSGDYSYYNYDSYEYGINSSSTPSPRSGSSSENKIYITGFSGGVTKVVVNVTPYNSNGVAGDMVSASYIRESSNIKAITSCTKYGNIYSPSGNKVDGLTKSYLIDGGAATYERHDLTDGWHIVAVNQYYDGTVYWYELYDADDGDYYGWVNSSYIAFY